MAAQRFPATDSRQRGHFRTERPLDRWLLRAGDASLCAAVVFAPWFMGGRGAVGRLVLAVLIAIASGSWLIRQSLQAAPRWRWSGAEWLILAGGLVVAMQLLPLPPPLLYRISPMLKELLPLWQQPASSPVQLGVWQTISLTPEATRGGLAMYLLYGLLFTLVIQRLDSVSDIERTMKWLALAGIAMAAVGMLQLLFGNGKFLWVYEHPSRDTFVKVNGTFQNQNHFAHFVALSLGPVLWWLHWVWSGPPATSHRRRGQPQAPGWLRAGTKHGLAVGLGIMILASLLTYSRGGVLSVAVATLATLAVYYGKGFLGRSSLLAAGVVGAIVALAVGIYGYDFLASRMSTLMSGSLEQVSQSRLDLWRAQWEAIPRFALLGTGVGSHADIYPTFMEQHYDVNFSHGENGYFQLLLETGVGGLVGLLTGFALSFRWCLVTLFARAASRQQVTLAGAILPGLLASLTQSCGDFVWYIPACMTSTLVLAACACRLFQIQRTPGEPSPGAPPVASERSRDGVSNLIWLPRAAAPLLAAFLVACHGAVVNHWCGPALSVPHWDAYVRLALPVASSSAGLSAGQDERLAAMQFHLENALRYAPRDARAHLMLATIQLRRFELEQRHAENPMGLTQIRDAALSSRFPSKSAQDAWLQVAVGKNVQLLYGALDHCRQALQRTPLQGDGYLYLGELAFIEHPRPEVSRDFLRQAYRVRPHSGATLFALGKEAALAGDLGRTLQCWRKAFHQDPDVQVMIIDSLANQLSGEFLVEQFQPDLVGLRRLHTIYREAGRELDANAVGTRLVAALEAAVAKAAPLQAVDYLGEAHHVHVAHGRTVEAIRCAQRAVALAPHHLTMRRLLAAALTQGQRYVEAEREWEWCLRRHPTDESLRESLRQVRLARAESQSAVSPATNSRQRLPASMQ